MRLQRTGVETLRCDLPESGTGYYHVEAAGCIVTDLVAAVRLRHCRADDPALGDQGDRCEWHCPAQRIRHPALHHGGIPGQRGRRQAEEQEALNRPAVHRFPAGHANHFLLHSSDMRAECRRITGDAGNAETARVAVHDRIDRRRR